MTFRRKPILARARRLCLVREASGRTSVMHARTGLALHSALQDLQPRIGERALRLAAQLDVWDFSDPNEVKERHFRETEDLWQALVTIRQMAEAE